MAGTGSRDWDDTPSDVLEPVSAGSTLRDTFTGSEPPAEVAAAAKDPRSRTGRYIRVRPLGRGGRSYVWLAWDPDLTRYVALKVLLSSEDPVEVQRFHREAQTAAKLTHANIAPIHEVGSEVDAAGRQIHYIAMDYVDGLTLGRIRLDRAALIAAIRDCTLALDYAHRQGVIHRDIKPSNIMVDSKGHPFLMDFGLAKTADFPSTLTLSGQILGTPAYMSPEQAQGKVRELTPRTDVYGMGATLYEMLCRRKPFEGEDPYDILKQVIEVDPLAPRKVEPGLSKDLETIILRAMDKDPARRYASARDLADDLTRYLAGDPILARRTSRFTRAYKIARKNRAIAALAILLAATSVVVPGLLIRSRVMAAKARTEQQRIESCRRMEALQSALHEARRTGDEKHFHNVLFIDPGNAEALAALSDVYFRKWKSAIDDADAKYSDDFENLVRAYDRAGRYAEALRRQGILGLQTQPDGAIVEARKYQDRGGRFSIEGAAVSLGETPLSATLETGSYILTVRKEGFAEVRLPVLVGRNSSETLRLKLYTDADVGAGFVHVPPGSFLQGEKRKRVEVHEFFISRDEVTCGEYLEFLTSLWAEGRISEARRRRPRAQEAEGWYFLENEKGIFIPAKWNPQWPVMSISWDDASAYCAWRSLRDRRTCRLPREIEWEKAARGVDGRVFPWGNVWDPTHCKNPFSKPHDVEPGPEPVGSYEADVSPYGVRDLAGGAREWCVDEVPARPGWRMVRGGSWSVVEQVYFRSETGVAMRGDSIKSSCGIRLVREARP